MQLTHVKAMVDGEEMEIAVSVHCDHLILLYFISIIFI